MSVCFGLHWIPCRLSVVMRLISRFKDMIQTDTRVNSNECSGTPCLDWFPRRGNTQSCSLSQTCVHRHFSLSHTHFKQEFTKLHMTLLPRLNQCFPQRRNDVWESLWNTTLIIITSLNYWMEQPKRGARGVHNTATHLTFHPTAQFK